MDIGAQINQLKLEYCFRISTHTALEQKDTIENFVFGCLSAYEGFHRHIDSKPDQHKEGEKESTDKADDACLLAAMALIHLAQITSVGRAGRPYLFQALCILELLSLKSPSNYQMLLLLSRVQLLLGAGSLALRTFGRLSIKHIQLDTTLHLLLSRISTIHPHIVSGTEDAMTELKDRDPMMALQIAQDFYASSRRAQKNATTSGLKCGSYSNVEGSINLGYRLQSSICGLMWALESRRIQRLYTSSTEEYWQTIGERCANVWTIITADPLL